MSCSKPQNLQRGCCVHGTNSPMKSMNNCINDYKAKHNLHKNLKRKLSIPQAVYGNVCSPAFPSMMDKLTEKEWENVMDNFHSHPHQSRYYSKESLKEIAKHLAAHWNRNTFKDFEDLYEYVSSILVKTATNQSGLVKKSYALIIYDIAIRLAYRYGVWPKKYVYLNGTGPYNAVNDLGLKAYIGKQGRILYADIIKNYPELGKLDAAQLEDILCIYHNQLANFKHNVII